MIMSRKRPLSPDSGFSPLTKVRVSTKMVKENEKLRMETVYEKTLKLLYSGSKKLGSRLPLNNGMKDTAVPNCLSLPCDNYKQLCIAVDGKLISAEKPLMQPESLIKSCFSCHNTTFTRCSYCENSLCECCLRICQSCLEKFCCHCCLHLYSDNVDNVVCKSCC